MTLDLRLKRVMALLGLDHASKLAQAVGLPGGTLRAQISRDSLSKSTEKKIRLLLKRRGIEVSTDWLMHGEGEPPVRRHDPTEPDDIAIEQQLGESQDYIAVREFDVRAAMGGGSIVDSEKYIGSWSLPGVLIKGQTTAAPANLTFIQTIGESMTPDFPPGSRVLVDLSDTVPTPPGIFIVWDGMGVVLKRVEFVPHSDPPRIRLSSINPAYSAYERPLDDALIRGRVIGRWAWV